MRCATTGRKSASMSSGTTYDRPESRAHARAARSSAGEARTEAPSATPSSVRVTKNQLEQPVHEQTVDVDVLDGAVQLEQLVRGHGGLQLSERVAVPLLEHDAPLAVQVGVAERRLPGRSGRGASGSGKVPSCSIGFSVAAAGTASAAGASRRRPSPGSRPSPRAVPTASSASHVDLVHEHDVREQRPEAELELARARVAPRDRSRRSAAGPSALNARGDRALDRLCDRARKDGLRRPGDVLEEHARRTPSAASTRPDLVRLAVDDRLHVVGQPRGDRGGLLEPNGFAALRRRCVSPRHAPNRRHARDKLAVQAGLRPRLRLATFMWSEP